MVTRAEQKAATRERLLRAAERIATREGFARLSLDRVAEAAGLTKGAIYSNFESKEDLIVQVADRLLASLNTTTEMILQAADFHDLMPKLVEMLLELRSRLGLDQVVRFLFEQAGADGEHPVAADDVAQLYRVSDAVLLPSDAEGFGLPLVEAALARVPVVCADLPVFREVGGAGLYTFPVAADATQVAAHFAAWISSHDRAACPTAR